MKNWMTPEIQKARRERKFKAQAGLCHWCKKPMSLEPIHTTEKGRVKDNELYATFEHLVRRREGGAAMPNNVVLAHARCNRKREKEYKSPQQQAAE